MKRSAQISFGFSGLFAPSFLPAFHAGPCSTGSYDECRIIILRWPGWPTGEQIGWGHVANTPQSPSLSESELRSYNRAHSGLIPDVELERRTPEGGCPGAPRSSSRIRRFPP